MPNKKNYDYIIPGYKFPVSNVECVSNHYERRDKSTDTKSNGKLRHYVMVRCPFCKTEFEGRLDRLEFNPEKSEGPRTYCCNNCGQKHKRPYKDPWRDSPTNTAEKQGINLKRVKDYSGYIIGDSVILPASEGRTTHDGHAQWKALCSCGRTFYVDTGYIIGTRNNYIKCCCDVCSKAVSTGEQLVEKWLKDHQNLKFEHHHKFKDLRGLGGGLLDFDFAIFDNDQIKYLIEFNGKQHYEPVEFYGGIERFKKQQEHDKRKQEYCIKHNIILIEIPYNYKNLDDYLNQIEVK